MAMQIRKAQRSKAKLRMGLIGPTGSGKTYSALRLAFGIGTRVGIIDTENGSADLYADLGDYDVITLVKPYTVASYREALSAFEDAGYDVIIIDSLSHAWAGSGGMLDRQGQIEKRLNNSYTAWREITPEHNALVEAMLTSPAHIIATLRVKTEYVIEKNGQGKMVPRKIGLAPVFRDGIEYEMTLVMDIDADHKASASKDRTKLFRDWYDEITERTGQTLLNWLEQGTQERPPPSRIEAPPVAEAPRPAPLPSAWMDKVEVAMKALRTEAEVEQAIAGERMQAALSTFDGEDLARLQRIIAATRERFGTPPIENAPENADDAWPGPTPEQVRAEREAAAA